MMSGSSRTPSPESSDRSSPNPAFAIQSFITAFNINNHKKMREHLLENRGLANLELKRAGGMNPTKKPILIYAISKQDYTAVELLLDFGAIVTKEVRYAAVNNRHSPSIDESQQIPVTLYKRLMQEPRDTASPTTYGSTDATPRNSMAFEVASKTKVKSKTSCCCPWLGPK